ncbi:MAG: methyltransferase domain-containing protein [Ginsengibacter sp.]
MDKTECQICLKTAKRIFKDFPGYQEGDNFDIFYCEGCNTSFPFPVVTNLNKLYELIYQNKEQIAGYNRYYKYAIEIKKEKDALKFLAFQEPTYYGVWEKISKENIAEKKIKVLEVGCGLGYLTYALNQSGYNTLGLDISGEAVEFAKNTFGDYYLQSDVFEFATSYKEKFDFIVLTEVVEHVISPVEFIKTLLGLLAPEGKLIVSTPNKSLYPATTVWASDLPPVHLWWFSEKSMVRIAELTGSSVSFIDFEEYHKKMPTLIDLGGPFPNGLPPHVFSKEGKLLNPIKKLNSYDKFKEYLTHIKIVRNVYYRFMKIRNPKFIFLKSKSWAMCAVFEK